MAEDVKQMISEGVEAAEGEIQGKGQPGDESCVKVLPKSGEIAQVPDGRTCDKCSSVIEIEPCLEGVGVYRESQGGD